VTWPATSAWKRVPTSVACGSPSDAIVAVVPVQMLHGQP
jgi:hypothetical protein